MTLSVVSSSLQEARLAGRRAARQGQGLLGRLILSWLEGLASKPGGRKLGLSRPSLPQSAESGREFSDVHQTSHWFGSTCKRPPINGNESNPCPSADGSHAHIRASARHMCPAR